jgi:hypothetical protein
MVVPAAMFIEMAQDMLKTHDPAQLKDQEKKLRFALGDQANDDVVKGYLLGLETMRALLAGNVKASQAGV